jgi:hypothetical protein
MLENYITELYNRSNRPVNLEVEPEKGVDVDQNDSYTWAIQ